MYSNYKSQNLSLLSCCCDTIELLINELFIILSLSSLPLLSPSPLPPPSPQDLMNIAKTTLSSKILTQHKDLFAGLAVEAVGRLKRSGNLEAIQIIKKLGGSLSDSYLEEGTVAFWKQGCDHYPSRSKLSPFTLVYTFVFKPYINITILLTATKKL